MTSMRTTEVYAYSGWRINAESSGSVEVTVKNWHDQVDGVSDKRRIRVKKTVHFGGARKIPE